MRIVICLNHNSTESTEDCIHSTEVFSPTSIFIAATVSWLLAPVQLYDYDACHKDRTAQSNRPYTHAHRHALAGRHVQTTPYRTWHWYSESVAAESFPLMLTTNFRPYRYFVTTITNLSHTVCVCISYKKQKVTHPSRFTETSAPLLVKPPTFCSICSRELVLLVEFRKDPPASFYQHRHIYTLMVYGLWLPTAVALW